jgi:hypothetical protein
VVAVRRRIEEMVEKEVSRLVRPGPVREAILVPWRLDDEGRPPDVGQLEEVEAIIGVVSGTGAGLTSLLTSFSTISSILLLTATTLWSVDD